MVRAAPDQMSICALVGKSRKLCGVPVSKLSVGDASHASQPISCNSAARQTSSRGENSPMNAFPHARANCPLTCAWAGCVMTIKPCCSSCRCSIAPAQLLVVSQPHDDLRAIVSTHHLPGRDGGTHLEEACQRSQQYQ